MEKMKRCGNYMNTNENNSEVPKKKERHLVSWTPQEDDILREQIQKLGTDNWSIIASKFEDKTTRQCRRRWYSYLNSDFKKGGWSPEEDMLLCEAQKIFGNKWTEIAKVVSGRTDNAVKNRFSTLCKKRAKHEATTKDMTNSFINIHNKRVNFLNETSKDRAHESVVVPKKMRTDISIASETLSKGEKSVGEYVTVYEQLGSPFATLTQDLDNCAKSLLIQQQDHNEVGEIAYAQDRIRGMFLEKDDPRMVVLLQEDLSSLALKVNSEDTDHNLDSSWQLLQGYRIQTKQADPTRTTISCSSYDVPYFNQSVEDLTSSNGSSRPFSRLSDLHGYSPSISDYSTGSTLYSQVEDQRIETSQAEKCVFTGSESVQGNNLLLCHHAEMEFSSPIIQAPLFRSLAASVSTPNFSESERKFLLKTLGLECTSPKPTANPTEPPPCKRVLLHSL